MLMQGSEQIFVEYVFPQTPAKVWRALTEPDLLAAWLMPNDIRPVVGHRFNFRSQPMGDWNGVVDCEILEVVEQKKLVYTWLGGSTRNEGFGHKLETRVTWTLEPSEDGGTVLRLVRSGFHPDDFALKAMGQGWNSKGTAIAKILAALP